MRRVSFVCLIGTIVIIGCNNDDAPLRRADGSAFSSSGDVQLTDGSHLQFAITSERYKQWEAARSDLRRNVVVRFGKLLHPDAPTQSSIVRAIAFLETDAASRESIERSGMTVRDFVLMTVALEQEMRLASQAGAPPSESQPLPYPMDTMATRTNTYADSVAAESLALARAAVLDSARRAGEGTTRRLDSLRRADSLAMRRFDSLARRRADSLTRARSDSSIQRKPDSLAKPPRDTVRDTLESPPADFQGSA